MTLYYMPCFEINLGNVCKQADTHFYEEGEQDGDSRKEYLGVCKHLSMKSQCSSLEVIHNADLPESKNVEIVAFQTIT